MLTALVLLGIAALTILASLFVFAAKKPTRAEIKIDSDEEFHNRRR